MASDLIELIDFASMECLNEKPGHSAHNALAQGSRDDDGAFLESDADEQLLLKLPFKQAVKLNSIIIKGAGDGTGPKRVRLYVNQPSLSFSDVASVPSAQELELTAAQLSGHPTPLKFVKFQGVTTLAIFVESNQGGEDTSRVLKIALLGTCGAVCDVSKIKKTC